MMCVLKRWEMLAADFVVNCRRHFLCMRRKLERELSNRKSSKLKINEF